MQLHNLDIDIFLRDYWQQKPCLIRQAFPHFSSPISPEELAGLACEEGVFSRLIIEKHGAKPWQLVNGPFSEEDFVNLPETHYSLLVSECDKWIPELKPIVEQFQFIPKWRIDDLMISYAPKHGSVGAHLDQYDVFLLQAQGQRRWQIQLPETLDSELVEDIDIALLKYFKAEQEWVVEPGDLLYLPAGVAHFGVALNPCLTYSIGFRAPSEQEILEGALQTSKQLQLFDDATRYRDPTLTRQRHNSEITQTEVLQFKALLEQALEKTKHSLPVSCGQVFTSKSIDLDLVCNEDVQFTQDSFLSKHPDALLAYHVSANDILFFYNGQSQSVDVASLAAIQYICDNNDFQISDIPNSSATDFQQLIQTLVQESILLVGE